MYFEIAQSLSERFAVGIKLKTTQVFDKIGVKYQKENFDSSKISIGFSIILFAFHQISFVMIEPHKITFQAFFIAFAKFLSLYHVLQTVSNFQ